MLGRTTQLEQKLMRTVIDATGRVVACGESASLTPPEGGRVLEADTTELLFSLTGSEEAYYDGTAFVKRARVVSADEADELDIRDKLKDALTNWDSLTAQQKDRAQKVMLRALVRLIR